MKNDRGRRDPHPAVARRFLPLGARGNGRGRVEGCSPICSPHRRPCGLMRWLTRRRNRTSMPAPTRRVTSRPDWRSAERWAKRRSPGARPTGRARRGTAGARLASTRATASGRHRLGRRRRPPNRRPASGRAGCSHPVASSARRRHRPSGSAGFRAAAQEIVDIQKNLTDEHKRVAKSWEGAQGTPLPAGIAMGVAMADIENAVAEGDTASRWTIPQSTRAMALLAITMHDGAIAVWDAKYTYWNPRPETPFATWASTATGSPNSRPRSSRRTPRAAPATPVASRRS